MFQLRVETGCRAGERIALPPQPDAPVLLGRGQEVAVRFPRDATMSRVHAELLKIGQQWVLQNRSRSLTQVGEHRVSDRWRLNPGDVIQLGETRLILEELPEPPSPPALTPGEDPAAEEQPDEDSVFTGDPARDRRNVRLLLDAIEAIHRSSDPAAALTGLVDRAVALTGAERGLLLLRGGEGLETLVARSRGGEDLERVEGASRSVPRQVIETGQPVVITDERGQASSSMQLYELRSILCVPIRQGGSLCGVIYVDSQEPDAPLGQQELVFLEALAAQCGIALERARVRSDEVRERTRLEEEITALRGRRAARPLTVSEAMDAVLRRVERVADSEVTILITGETGTGKEVVARYVHQLSARRERPLVVVDCGAIPEQLLESVLFGHVRGAFSGATGDQEGLVARAAGGTLLLDEVGELPLQLQPKLLRFLEERSFLPVGSNERRQVDARIVACTHRDLEALVAQGRFRQDLLYRLNAFPVHLPPLRERPEDVVPLARLLLARAREAARAPALSGFTQEAEEALRAHAWPGNVRELGHRLQRAAVTAEPPVITLADLDLSAAPGRTAGVLPLPEARRAAMDRFERDYVRELLRRHQGRVQDAAREAGVSRQMFQRLMARHEIARQAFREGPA